MKSRSKRGPSLSVVVIDSASQPLNRHGKRDQVGDVGRVRSRVWRDHSSRGGCRQLLPVKARSAEPRAHPQSSYQKKITGHYHRFATNSLCSRLTQPLLGLMPKQNQK
jgi:hypothetical protein